MRLDLKSFPEHRHHVFVTLGLSGLSFNTTFLNIEHN